MKQLLSSILILSIIISSAVICVAASSQLKGTLTLSGAWAIYPTAVKWGEEFMKKNPGVRVDISAGGAGKGATDAIAGLVDIGMVSRDPDPSEVKRGAFPIAILHDAVFPTISIKNPAINELQSTGLTADQLTKIWITGNVVNWNQVSKTKSNSAIHVYTRSDACGAAATWAKFLGNKKQEDLKGIAVYGDPGLLETVKRDMLGIGYNNYSFVYTREGQVVSGITLLPVDANKNGKADPDEILDTRDKAKSAIEKGAYPAGRKNFFFTKGKPKGLAKAFIRFALSDEGAKFVDEVGTSLPLPKSDRDKIIKSLD